MRKEKLGMEDKSRSLPMDPNLPQWDCQNCRHSLCVIGVDSYDSKFFNNYFSCSRMQGSSIHGVNSVIGSTNRRVWTTLLLCDQRKSPSSKSHKGFFLVLVLEAGAVQSAISQAWETMMIHCSFAASQLGFLLDYISVFKLAFEIATIQTQVEQPLCLECMRALSDKLDKEVED
ncbi:beclin-1-like protein [Quercus suber]|uniref:Beclin-1-like protein n=1 Tax=Quercus suber TaxID=58331 RepID=A0AAW0K4F4_QUESU